MHVATRRVATITNHLSAPSSSASSPSFEREEVAATRSTNDSDVVIVVASRTPVGKAKRGALKDTPADDLLIPVLQHIHNAMKTKGMTSDMIGDIVVGSVAATVYQLRAAALLAGYSESVAVKRIDRLCGSGLQAIADVAYAIKGGAYEIGIAAGVESMSTFQRPSHAPNPKAKGQPLIEGVYLPMGNTSENVATRYNISRERQDQFAQVSQNKAADAAAAGKFDDEIAPITATPAPPSKNTDANATTKPAPSETLKNTDPVVLSKDEGIRRTTVEALAKLKPAFSPMGGSTAGNSSQVSDGASAVLLMTRATAKKYGWEILGSIQSFAVAGCEPAVMGIGPTVALPQALEKANIGVKDVDLFELNEAFASQALYCIDQLGLDINKVNVNGGAIALGHPLGSTGVRLTTTLLHEMKRRNVHYGVVSMCIGGGMGTAAVFARD